MTWLSLVKWIGFALFAQKLNWDSEIDKRSSNGEGHRRKRERTPAKENWCLLYLCFCWFVFNWEIYYKSLRSQQQSGLKCIHAGVITTQYLPMYKWSRTWKFKRGCGFIYQWRNSKQWILEFNIQRYIHAGSNLHMACTHRWRIMVNSQYFTEACPLAC